MGLECLHGSHLAFAVASTPDALPRYLVIPPTLENLTPLYVTLHHTRIVDVYVESHETELERASQYEEYIDTHRACTAYAFMLSMGLLLYVAVIAVAIRLAV